MERTELYSHLAHCLAGYGGIRHIPEYLPMKFYNEKASSAILVRNYRDIHEVAYPDMFDSTLSFLLLDAHFRSVDPELEDGNYVERYAALKKTSRIGKLAAQVYRILNIYHQATVYAPDRLDHTDELVRMNYTHRNIAYTLIITKSGLSLCDSFVLYYLSSFSMPHSDEYVEAMLTAYYNDIAGQIKKMFDEEGCEQLFRPRYDFNRRFRYNCRNARYRIDGGFLSVEMEDRFDDRRVYPIDFFLTLSDGSYIIPVEVLSDKKIRLGDLPLWKTRNTDEDRCSVNIDAMKAGESE